MRNRVETPILSARVFALVGALCSSLVACQSEPTTSKEPARSEPAATASAPAPANPAPAAAPAMAQTEPVALKLTGSAPSPAAAPATGDQPSAKPASEVAAQAGAADKGTTGKGAADNGADKSAPDKGAAEKSAAAKTVQGNVVNEEPFSAWLQVASPAKAGAPVQLEAVLVAKPPYHCNDEYPHKFKLSAAPAGLTYPEETVRGMKVTPERGVLAIPVNAQGAGKPTVGGTLSFSVCTEERCLVEKRELSVTLDVM